MVNAIAQKRTTLFILSLSLLLSPMLQASHNTNRYVPFLERTQRYTTYDKSHLDANLFYISISSAFSREKGSTSPIGLWGEYNLKDVIKSLKTVNGDEYVSPLKQLTGTNEFSDEDLWFDSPGRIRAQGLSLNGVWHPKKYPCLSLGAWLPIMHIQTRSRYKTGLGPCTNEIKPGPIILDEFCRDTLIFRAARRQAHNDLGLRNNFWSKTGVGDLDLYVGWHHTIDYALRMKKIMLIAQTGVLVPVGTLANIDVPASIPFMGNNHWGLYGDIVTEFELKQDVKVGLMAGITGQFKHKHTVRIPVATEPAPFSALKGDVDIHPGITLKLSPYLILENLTDGLHIQGRYTYLRHAHDTWKDRRCDKTINSYLTSACGVESKERLSSWRSHYFTFDLTYDTALASNKLPMLPRFYVTYDMPIGGRGIADTHQLTLGAQLLF
jgi:hypothetical protein